MSLRRGPLGGADLSTGVAEMRYPRLSGPPENRGTATSAVPAPLFAIFTRLVDL